MSSSCVAWFQTAKWVADMGCLVLSQATIFSILKILK